MTEKLTIMDLPLSHEHVHGPHQSHQYHWALKKQGKTGNP